ncbi:carbohydrate kinase [Arsenicicoccus cauae]|uniref:Carbohydrate kinase n=1 Tax=Arsenicicoccus cauae TaxID=2663847 RepID=A0A6I3ICU7_9MICO|nr:carbohydrate kinase [Arsenicicoccus cauae]MTB70483.1 carbohydrate kinase [Arsenicicoccus cauae]
MTDRLLVVGESLVDIVHRQGGAVDEHPGGSPANVAIGLARLGHPVDFATQFGRDAHGEMVRAHLVQERLLTLTSGSDQAESTSTAKATLDAAGGATYDFELLWDVAGALDEDAVGHLHTGSIAATLEPGGSAVVDAALRARATGTVSYDPNARPTIMGTPEEVRQRIEQLVGLSDVVKASDEDVDWLYPGATPEQIMELWGRLGPELVVVTRGGAGALVLIPRTGERLVAEATRTTVVDTVGAGDSFMSGLISGLLDAGLLGSVEARERLRTASLPDVRPAIERAVACGAITVSRAGANPPTRAEL